MDLETGGHLCVFREFTMDRDVLERAEEREAVGALSHLPGKCIPALPLLLPTEGRRAEHCCLSIHAGAAAVFDPVSVGSAFLVLLGPHRGACVREFKQQYSRLGTNCLK